MEFKMCIEIQDEKLSRSQLDTLISILKASHKLDKKSSLKDYSRVLKLEFDVDVPEGQLFEYFQLEIELEDSALIAETAGYDRRN
jgi:hypothetical protein